MEIKEARLGQRVYCETDNNGPIWRGEITEIQTNGFVFVRWDGGFGQQAHALEDLTPEQ